MSHVSCRRLISALVGTLLVILTYGCSSSPNGSAGPDQSEQQLYVARLSQDRQSLDRGVLAYSSIGNLKTAATAQFQVTVTDTGKGPQTARLTSFNGMTVYQRDVPTGGIVGVQIVACENLTCHSESGTTQPVLEKGQQAQWFWTITAGTPGPAVITLRADTYDQGTAQSLSEEIVTVDLRVVATAAFNTQQNHAKIATVTDSVVGDIETIGSIAGAIVAVGGIVGWVIMMRRKRKAKARKAEARKAKARERPPTGIDPKV